MKSDGFNSILVIDDDNDVLYTARLIFRGLFDQVDTLDRPCLIPEYLKIRKYDIILLDLNFTRGSTTGKEGLEWLEKILRIDPKACVLTTSAYGEINLAVQVMKNGASDFITKPWNKEQLISSVNNALSARHDHKGTKMSKNKYSDSVNPAGLKYPEIISRSPVMKKLVETIKIVAPTNANVLIMGENGTGKELVAWALHNESLRRQEAFVHVDLGAIPESLFEAELFGHTRGAFTNALEDRIGRFEAASGGTLFLDEIGNLSLQLQAKILTAIHDKEVIRIGSNHPIPVDIRLISASNMPLYKMVDSFEFRQDLLYRINTVDITIPPLRERKEDIRPLSEFYLNLFSGQYGKTGLNIREDTFGKLEEYPWPGNIRELAHAFERAVILGKSNILRPEDFNLQVKSAPVLLYDETAATMGDYEKNAISTALIKFNGNLSKVAETLGIARSTLYRKIALFGPGMGVGY